MDEGKGALIRVSGVWPVVPVIFLGVTACSLVNDEVDENAEQVYGRNWVAAEVAGQPVAPDVESSLVIASDGKVSGHAGCNGYFGSAILDGEAMSFGNLGSTRMACPEPAMGQEDRLLRALDSTRGYLLKDEMLLLLDGSGVTVVRFRLSEGT